jgi:hypothetical protein
MLRDSAPGSGRLERSGIGPNRANRQPELNDSRSRGEVSCATVDQFIVASAARIAAGGTHLMIRYLCE